jgi:hypothetical protein
MTLATYELFCASATARLGRWQGSFFERTIQIR